MLMCEYPCRPPVPHTETVTSPSRGDAHIVSPPGTSLWSLAASRRASEVSFGVSSVHVHAYLLQALVLVALLLLQVMVMMIMMMMLRRYHEDGVIIITWNVHTLCT